VGCFQGGGIPAAAAMATALARVAVTAAARDLIDFPLEAGVGEARREQLGAVARRAVAGAGARQVTVAAAADMHAIVLYKDQGSVGAEA